MCKSKSIPKRVKSSGRNLLTDTTTFSGIYETHKMWKLLSFRGMIWGFCYWLLKIPAKMRIWHLSKCVKIHWGVPSVFTTNIHWILICQIALFIVTLVVLESFSCGSSAILSRPHIISYASAVFNCSCINKTEMLWITFSLKGNRHLGGCWSAVLYADQQPGLWIGTVSL